MADWLSVSPITRSVVKGKVYTVGFSASGPQIMAYWPLKPYRVDPFIKRSVQAKGIRILRSDEERMSRTSFTLRVPSA